MGISQLMHAATVVLLLAASVRTDAKRVGRLLRDSRERAAAASRQPWDVGAAFDPVDDLLSEVGMDVANAASEVQNAAREAASPAIEDPQGALEEAVAEAEGTIKNIAPVQGLPTNVFVKPPTAASLQATPPTASTASLPGGGDMGPPVPPFGGVFCRGAACQYRVETTSPPSQRLHMPGSPGEEQSGTNEQELSKKDFCRGLGCASKTGWPPDHSRGKFVTDCMHLFTEGGLVGDDASRQVLDVRESFDKICRVRVDAREAAYCEDYSDVFVAALAPFIHEPSTGDADQVCRSAQSFVSAFKKAEVDFQLSVSALWPLGPPEVNETSSNRTGVGKTYEVARSGGVAIVVRDDLFQHCSKQLRVVAGKERSAPAILQIFRDWCAGQASVTSWLGVDDYGHPEWTGRSCTGMEQLLAFGLRQELSSRNVLPPEAVCKSVFAGISAVHGVDRIVKGSRAPPPRGVPPAKDSSQPMEEDLEVRELAREALKRKEAIFARLQRQKEASEALETAKSQIAAYGADQQA